jgi:hypothetical protein
MTHDRYRNEIERLLDQIRERVHELQVLKAYGARSPALRTKKDELKQMRLALAQAVRR